MRRAARRERRRTRVAAAVVALIAVVAVVLVLLATRHGPQVTDDSANYLAGARSIAAGDGYRAYSGEDQALFPPGLSLTLAGIDRLGVDPVDGARGLGAVSIGALVVLTFLLARGHVRRQWLAVASAAGVGCSAAALNVYSTIWSETVFCVAAVGLLLVLEQLMARRGRGACWAIAAAALASVGFAYRYAGVTLLVLPIVIIVVAAWRDGIGAVVRRLAPYVLASLVVPAVILGRNLDVGSDLFGRRHGGTDTLRRVLEDTASTLRDWATGAVSVPSVLGYLVLVVLAVVTVAGLVVVVRRDRTGAEAPEASLLPILTFVAIYVAYLWAAELGTTINNVTNRLLSPVFAPVVMLLFIAIDALLDLDAVRRARWVVPAVGIGIVLVLGVFAVRAVRDARFINRSGEQGTAARAREVPELAAAVNALPADTHIYTNDPVALYFATAHLPSSFPSSRFPRADGVVFAWHSSSPDPTVESPDDLRRTGAELALIGRAGDWTLYRVSR